MREFEEKWDTEYESTNALVLVLFTQLDSRSTVLQGLLGQQKGMDLWYLYWMWTIWIVHWLLHGIWVAIVLYHKKTGDKCSSEKNITVSRLAKKKKGTAIY